MGMNTSSRLAGRKLLIPSLVFFLICGQAFALNLSQAEQNDPPESPDSLKDRITQQLTKDAEVSPTELAGATKMVNALPITEWL